MVTYFNRKDLVNFGKYLLSDERKENFTLLDKELEGKPGFDPEPVEDRLKHVYHADLENWLDSLKLLVI